MTVVEDRHPLRLTTSRTALLSLSVLLGLAAFGCMGNVADAPRKTARRGPQDTTTAVFLSATATQPPTVETPDGMFPAASYAGKIQSDVAAFLGIRFAAPPTGERRWQAPQPPRPSEGMIDATQFGSACPQLASPFGVESSDEDCLFLNVYVPQTADDPRNLPVMVYFYGGAFVSGASDLYDPTQLVTEGHAIVVTVNYRLGVLGYMASPALSDTSVDGVSGNYGLLDQQLALKWVNQNIAAFGGNPRNVTIFGESAGGFSVCTLLAAPSASGLFSRAITQSGPCAFPLPTLKASEQTGTTFTQAVDCERSSPQETVDCLRQLSTQEILDAQPSSADLVSSPTALTSFFPNVDGRIIPQQTSTALALGQFNQVPTIVGTNLDEGSLFIALAYDLLGGAPLTAAQYPEKIAQTAQALSAQLGSSADSLTQQILGEYPLTNYTSPDQALASVVGDGTFSCPALITDQLLSLNVRTYAYEFADRSAPMTLLDPVSFPYGATHTDELQYLFPPNTENSVLTPDQRELATTMRSYWTHFASRGSPNDVFSGQPYWPAYNLLTNDIMGFVAPVPALRSDFSGEHHCSFWQGILLQGAASSLLAPPPAQ